VYFAIRGRGEPIRLLHALTGAELEEVEYDRSTKGANAGTASMPFGQVPLWIDQDQWTLSQSDAILRYLGAQCGCYGLGVREDARINEALAGVESLRQKYLELVYGEFSEATREKYKHLHTSEESKAARCQGAHLGLLDAAVSRSSSAWAADTENPSVADMCAPLNDARLKLARPTADALSAVTHSQLFDIFDVHLRLFGEGLKVQFPHLARLYEAFAVLPGVSEYLASDARKNRPVNNNNNG